MGIALFSQEKAEIFSLPNHPRVWEVGRILELTQNGSQVPDPGI